MGKCLILVLLPAVIASLTITQDSDTSSHPRKAFHQVPPVYPDWAKRLQLSGVVKLRVTIDPTGSVKLIEPVGGNPVLIKAAQEAVTNWKYAHAPHETQELIELHFGAR